MNYDLDAIKKLINDGKLDEAERELESILREEKVNKRALFLYGLAAYNKKEFDMAKLRYEEALKNDPDSPWPLMGIIDCYIALDELKEASELLGRYRNKFSHLLPF